MARERYLLNDDEEPINRPGAEITLKTKKDKWDNFWFYHRTHVIVGVILALLAAYFIYDMATKTSPDYNVAVLSSAYVSTDAGNLLAEEMEKYGEDLNGDGQVIVQVNIFQVAQGDDMDTADPQMQMASVVKFQGDVQMGESYIYLIDDLNFLAYGAEAGLFKNLDGTVPVEGETIDPEKIACPWRTARASRTPRSARRFPATSSRCAISATTSWKKTRTITPASSACSTRSSPAHSRQRGCIEQCFLTRCAAHKIKRRNKKSFPKCGKALYLYNISGLLQRSAVHGSGNLIAKASSSAARPASSAERIVSFSGRWSCSSCPRAPSA